MGDFVQFRWIKGFAAAGQKEQVLFHGIRHIFAVTDVDGGRMFIDVSLIEPAYAGTARRYVGPIANDSVCSIHGMLLYYRLLIELMLTTLFDFNVVGDRLHALDAGGDLIGALGLILGVNETAQLHAAFECLHLNAPARRSFIS